MAVTEIHPICSTVGQAIDYILNPEKTENQLLVSTVGCTPDGATAEKEFEQIRSMGTGRTETLAQHVYQSFAKGEVTSEQAHLIGLQLAEKLLKNSYQYVLATHVDKGHIHNHLIFNNVDFVNYRSFEYQENKGAKVYEKLRNISDDLCRENNLSVIANPEIGKGKSYYEWMMNKQGMSWKAKLKNEIDNAIMSSSNFDEFLSELSHRNVECVYRPENVITLKFRMEGQQKFCRARTLGWYYEEPQIKRRIEQYHLLKTGRTLQPQKSRFIDTTSKKFQNAKGLERWADIQNMKEAARLLNFLTENNISDVQELEDRAISRYGDRMQLVGKLNKIQSQIDEYTETIKQIKLYLKYKPYHDEYRQSDNRRKYAKENAAALEKYSSVKADLSRKFPDKRLPSLEHLYDERAELITQRNELNGKYKKLVAELKELDYARTAIADYVRSQQRDKQKTKDDALT